VTMQTAPRVSPVFALLIFAAAAGDGLVLAALYPALPAISEHFADVPYASAWVRGLVTAVNLAMVVGAPAAGYMVERFGTRKVLLTAALLFTISGLSGLIANSLWLLLASRFVLGLADVTVSTTVLALIAIRLDLARRNRWMGLFTSSGALFSFGWVQLAGVVAEHNWRFIFLFHLTGLATFASAAIALKLGDERSTLSRNSTEPNHHSPMKLLSLLPLVAIGAAAGAVENTTPMFLPFHLVEIGEGSPLHIAQAVMPVTMGVTISAFCYGYVRRYLSIGATFVLAFLSAGLTLICLGLAQSYTMVLLAVSFLGLGIGLLAPNVFAYAAVYGSSEHRARDVGIARGSFFVGAPVAQVLLEPVSEVAGNGMAIVALGCIALFLMLWPLTRGRRMGGD
jgi:MFS family permease